MTTVTLKAAPAANGWVEVWLVGDGGKTSGGLDLTGKKVLLDRVARKQLDAAGTTTVELLPTSSITPAGTVYRADFSAGGVQESLVFAGFPSTGTVDATDYVVDVPGALTPTALAAHISAADPHAGYATDADITALSGTYVRPGGSTVTPLAPLGYVNVKDYGAVGDGVADDTSALAAAIAVGLPVFIPANTTLLVSAPIGVGNGFTILGANNRNSKIASTHAGAVFASTTPEARTYEWNIQSVRFTGPGKTVVGSVALDLRSVSSGVYEDCTFTGYEKGVRLSGPTSGFAVYNRFLRCTTTTCGRGFSLESLGCNGTTFVTCRTNLCDIGLRIEDSNQCSWIGGEHEGNGIGVYANATANALADASIIAAARFEGNTTAWQVASANVRDFSVVDPRVFGTYTVSDTGTRTTHRGAVTQQGNRESSAAALAAGSWRYERSANGGTELPAFVVRDTATGSGTPVTHQVETERGVGYFYRGVRGGTNYFDVDVNGHVRLPQGGYVELTERADPSAPATNNLRLFARDNGAGKTQLCVRFATGAVAVLATEP